MCKYSDKGVYAIADDESSRGQFKRWNKTIPIRMR